jgi:hypothetical protein
MENIKDQLNCIMDMAERGKSPTIKYTGDFGKMSNDAATEMRGVLHHIASAIAMVIRDIDENNSHQ